MIKYCILCDLDGVLFDSREWHKYAPTKKDDREGWDEFQKHVDVCKPNYRMGEKLLKFNKIFPIIFITSRENTPFLLKETKAQIKKATKGQLIIGTRNKLFMRNFKDYRPAAKVKEEIYLKEIKDIYEPLFIIDDELENIKVFEKHGIRGIHYTKFK